MRKIYPFLIAFALTTPAFILKFPHIQAAAPLAALLCGLAILGASFLLTWACDVAQKDIPQALAIALVAFIAVLPEYAVDMYFTWMAGQQPESDYRHFAIANMTGANRLLIGLGWSTIAILHAFRAHRAVEMGQDKKLDLFFLLLATVFALSIPFRKSLTFVDGLIFLGLYVVYVLLILRKPPAGEEPEGAAAFLARLPRKQRISITAVLFIFSGFVILLNAEPFSENLVASGRVLGINEFLLVQWLAPIASEAPEFIIAIMFVLRGNASLALDSLVSSKLNQWTLLVGMIPGVYALSFGALSPPIQLDAHQFSEIFLTAAQSLFAISLLVSMRLSAWDGLWLALLFLAQLSSPLYDKWLEAALGWQPDSLRLHNYFGWFYIILACTIFAWRWRQLGSFFRFYRKD